MKCLIRFCVVFFICMGTWAAQAEDIANYAGCDVCDGAIHLEGAQAKNVLALAGMLAIPRLPIPDYNTIKIDLDGKLPQGGADTPDQGYEIKIWGSRVLYIKDLRDNSFIQVVTSRGVYTGPETINQYQPHIFLSAGHEHTIDLKDSVDLAWQKLGHTNIYKWVGDEKDKKAWLVQLGKKIFWAMENLK